MAKVKFPAPSNLYSSPEKKDFKEKNEKTVGPGSYLPSYSLTERATKNTKFSKASKMIENKPEDLFPLFPNYDFVLKTAPGVKICEESEKPAQLLAKKEEEDQREILKAMLHKTKSLDLPSNVVERITGGVIAPFVEIPIRYDESRTGPGRYELNYESIEPNVKGNVKYVESEFVKKPVKPIPGPGHYDLEEDFDIIGGFIPESPRSKSPKIDRRPDLNINIEILKPKIPSAIIPPEHTKPPLHPDTLGPGLYNPSFALVEKRTDIDVLPYVKNKEKEPEVDNRIPLNIKDDLTKPNKPSFVYHEPVIVLPPHLPESVLHKEQWNFYDFTANNKFEKVPQTTIAPVEFSEFKDYEKDKEILSKINKRLRGETNLPTVGTYDPEPVKERPPAYEFGKGVSRDPTYNGDILEEDKEGDVLILEPYVKAKVPMLVNMDKAVGRPDPIEDNDYKSFLLLEPKIDITKKKVPMFVNMDKEIGRKSENIEDEQMLVLEPNYFVSKKSQPMLVNMEKQQGRDPETLEPEEVVIVYSSEPKKEPKSLVDMNKQTGREEYKFDEDVVIVNLPSVVQHPGKPRILGIPDFSKITGREAEKEPELENEVFTHPNAALDVGKAYKATLPDPKTPAFDRYVPRMQEIVEESSDIPFVDTRKRRK